MLGVARFGQLALIQATVLLLGNLGEAGITLTTTKFTSRWKASDPQRAGRLVGWSLRATAISAVLMALLLVTVEPWVGRLGSASLTMEFLAGCGLLIFDMLGRIQLGALAGLEAFGATARVHVWRGLLLLPLVWLGARYGDLLGAILAMAAVSFATAAVGHRVLRRQLNGYSISPAYGASLESGVLTTSVSLWTSSLLLAGSTWVVAVLLSRQGMGFAELGLFNAAERWKTALVFLPNVLFQVVLPMLSRSHAAGDRRACRRIVSTALVSAAAVTGTAALLVFTLSPVLMSWYGKGFEAGADVLSLAALGAAVSALYTVGSGTLWALGKPTQMLSIDLFKTGLLLGLCFLGLASSAWGVALAYLLSFSAGTVTVMFFVHKEFQADSDHATA
jgi:O-antigen/teichoic acid export membrane protein